MKIALIGFGKMGQAIAAIAAQRAHQVIYKIDIDNRELLAPEILIKADVAIEFTSPHSAFDNVMACLTAGVPVVCGSTGWLQHLPQANAFCTEKNGSFICASNFSVGVNLFFALNQYLAGLMQHYPEYDVQMEEIHHTQKKDAPSGTAITIAEQLLRASPQKNTWVNSEAKAANELSIISKRIDPAPGTHTVKWHSAIDDIEITHTAHNRTGFATGAVLAAEYISTRKGIFTMQDVLGL
jgi:4-hydroxy-tetrahydrodipicolinate reductase